MARWQFFALIACSLALFTAAPSRTLAQDTDPPRPKPLPQLPRSTSTMPPSLPAPTPSDSVCKVYSLKDVAAAITAERLERVTRILHADLRSKFGIAEPRILVCGLNPHAGEGGHLGREEIEIIEPTLEHLRSEGMNLIGPLPADTNLQYSII